jgi:hypothetical protein
VAYLDADDVWRPDKLTRQLQLFQKDSRLGLVHTDELFIDGEGARAPRQKVHWYSPEHMSLVNLLRHNMIGVSSVMHKRSAFDGEYFAGELRACEDWDLWLRLVGNGHKVAYISDVLTEYRVHDANMSKQPERMLLATVSVMERMLSRPVGEDVKNIARRQQREAWRHLGHLMYERGDHALARSYFYRAFPLLGAADLRRVVATLIPRLAGVANKRSRER